MLDDELADRMMALASARNLIVHVYAEVDDDRLARFVHDGGLDDLSAFAARVAALVTW
ncbi:MAG: HepT-like ribonuclease domain-containing protein [Egibacteraceae bacterium]